MKVFNPGVTARGLVLVPGLWPGWLLLLLLLLVVVGVGAGVRQEVPPSEPIRGNTAANIDDDAFVPPLLLMALLLLLLLWLLLLLLLLWLA